MMVHCMTLVAALWAVIEAVEISNIKPQLDVQGNIVQAKDGNIFFHNSLWHQFGTSYGLCREDPPPHSGCLTMKVGSCGFRLDHNISLYTSPTLESGSWTLAAKNVLPVAS